MSNKCRRCPTKEGTSNKTEDDPNKTEEESKLTLQDRIDSAWATSNGLYIGSYYIRSYSYIIDKAVDAEGNSRRVDPTIEDETTGSGDSDSNGSTGVKSTTSGLSTTQQLIRASQPIGLQYAFADPQNFQF
uniref:Uncharacterized protein n=1 Tax=Oryza punctata TaxID=4537 RepID=A0A0E0LZE3_ORYPU